jgi:hypothetical protein
MCSWEGGVVAGSEVVVGCCHIRLAFANEFVIGTASILHSRMSGCHFGLAFANEVEVLSHYYKAEDQ